MHQCNQASMDARSEYHGRSIRLQLSETTRNASTYSFGESGGGGNTPSCSYCQDKGVYGGCPRCGLGGNGEIGEIIVTYCSGCHNPKDECRCCPVCKTYPCKCCRICWNYPCKCPIPTDPDACMICHKNPCECHRCQYCGQLLCYGTCLGGGGGNQGGDTGNTDPLKYIEKVVDRFAMGNIPRTMPTQLPNCCVPAIMEYINHLYGGIINQGDYILDYNIDYQKNVFANGVDLQDIPEFLAKHFDTAPITNIRDAISQGMVIFSDTPSQIPNSIHAIVVVGYGPSGTVIYMDPEKGYLCEAPASSVGKNVTIAIKGIKTK